MRRKEIYYKKKPYDEELQFFTAYHWAKEMEQLDNEEFGDNDDFDTDDELLIKQRERDKIFTELDPYQRKYYSSTGKSWDD